MPSGQVFQVTLRNGEALEGTLAEAQYSRFGLRLLADPSAKERGRRTLQRWIDYQDVNGLTVEGGPVATSSAARAPLVRIGDKTQIRTFAGDVVEGRIDDYEGATLLVDGRKLSLEGDVVRMDVRKGDSLLNGTLIGLGIGAGWSALMWAGCRDPDCAYYVGVASVFSIGVSTGVGVLADALNRDYTTVYTGALTDRKLTLAPIVTRDKKGILVRLSF
jgi:hypothetical protein